MRVEPFYVALIFIYISDFCRGGSMGVGEDTSLVWGHAMSQATGCLVAIENEASFLVCVLPVNVIWNRIRIYLSRVMQS